MERSVWKGYIGLGLVNIPVTLFTAEKKLDLHFKMIDSRNKARIRYIKVNEETGEEVPWDDVVKGYENEDHDYVLLTQKEIKEISTEYSKTININNFVNKESLNFMIFERPYYLVPDKGGEKGYIILRDTLKNTKKVGIAKVILHGREHLVALIPYENAILLNLLRYVQELRKPDEFALPEKSDKRYQISEKEMQIAQQLVNSMTVKWNHKEYKDEFRLALQKWIDEKAKKQAVEQKTSAKKKTPAKSSNVVDFMGLLKKSLKEKASHKKVTHTKLKSK